LLILQIETWTAMRGKFNYIVFLLRIIFALAFTTVSVYIIIIGPGRWTAGHDLSGVIGITSLWGIITFYIAFKIIRAIWTERFTLSLAGDGIIIKDLILFKHRTLQKADIKGFSLSEYPLRNNIFKSILFYLGDGTKVEFPQFLFLNFKKLTQALKESGITFFGEEPYVWKWVDSRYYKFDELDAENQS
jgi:hypothetical protein